MRQAYALAKPGLILYSQEECPEGASMYPEIMVILRGTCGYSKLLIPFNA
jgi:hypothetical protein